MARVGAIEARKWEDDETTFEQLQERITDTIEYLRNADEAKVTIIDLPLVACRDCFLTYLADTARTCAVSFA